MRVFGFSGHSGSGKTTLVTKLVPWLNARGLRVSTIKQANQGFDVDKPGKDSYEHRVAGASEVLVASPKRWALMHEYRGEPELSEAELLARMTPVDLVLVEGFRRWSHKRIEIWRAALGKDPLFADDAQVVAVASPDPVPGLDRPHLSLDDVDAIGLFVLDQVGLPR